MLIRVGRIYDWMRNKYTPDFLCGANHLSSYFVNDLGAKLYGKCILCV